MTGCKESEMALPTEQPDAKLDAADKKCMEGEMHASLGNILGNLISIVMFFGDTGTDVFIAIVHYRNGDYWYFGLTVTFIVVPSVVMGVFSTIWYIQDLKRHSGRHPVSTLRWTVRITFVVLQIAPVLRYVDSLIYGLKSRRKGKKKRSYHERMIYEYCDVAYLRLFEAFLESAPQLVLQIYILAKQLSQSTSKLPEIYQGVTISFSLVSVALALAFYHRKLRLSVSMKSKVSWTGTIVQAFWYMFVVGPRVLCLALLALLSPTSLVLLCLAHWAMMFTWILFMKTEFCETRFQEIMYDAALAVVFIFSYLNPVDQPTRYKYALYYVFIFIQNTIIIAVWCHFSSSSLSWLHLPVALFHYLSFAAGMGTMISYYLFLHPTGSIKVFRDSPISKNGVGEKEVQQSQSEC